MSRWCETPVKSNTAQLVDTFRTTLTHYTAATDPQANDTVLQWPPFGRTVRKDALQNSWMSASYRERRSQTSVSPVRGSESAQTVRLCLRRPMGLITCQRVLGYSKVTE